MAKNFLQVTQVVSGEDRSQPRLSGRGPHAHSITVLCSPHCLLLWVELCPPESSEGHVEVLTFSNSECDVICK